MYITIRDNSVAVLREQVKIGIPGDISKLVVDSQKGRCYSYYDRHSTTVIATALVVRLT